MSKKISYTLTPHISVEKLRVIREYNLHLGKEDYSNAIFDVMCDPVATKKVCAAIFDGDWNDVDPNDIDISYMHKGVQDFLSCLWRRSKESTPTENN